MKEPSDSFLQIERPEKLPIKSNKLLSQETKAFLETAENGKALRITIGTRNPKSVYQKFYNHIHKRGWHMTFCIEEDGKTAVVWASKSNPKEHKPK